MEKILNEELREGEKVLWKGKPESFETLDVTHKKPFITKAVLICGIVFALCLAYFIFATNKGIDVKYGLIAIAVVMAVFSSLHGLIEGKKIAKINYVITDQRLLVIDEVVKSVEYNTIKEAEFKADADGHTSLLCGSQAIKAKAHVWRMLTLGGAHMDLDSGLCDSFAFYAVPDADRVKKILSDFLPL